MSHLVLGKVLDRLSHVKKDGAAYLLGEELEAVLYVGIGQEVLQIPKLARIEIGTECIEITNHKQERFFFTPEQVIGFRIGGETNKLRGSAGFR